MNLVITKLYIIIIIYILSKSVSFSTWLLENSRSHLWFMSYFCPAEPVWTLLETFDYLLSISWNLLQPICSDADASSIPLKGGEPEVTSPGRLEGRVQWEFFPETLNQWESGRATSQEPKAQARPALFILISFGEQGKAGYGSKWSNQK